MQFVKRLRDAVQRGEITCSVRIWTRPHVKRGGRYALGAGAIEVDSVDSIALEDITPVLARESGFKSVVDLLKVAKHGRGRNIYLIRFHYLAPSASPAGGGARALAGAPPQAPASGTGKKNSARLRQRILTLIAHLPGAAALDRGPHMSLEVRGRRFGWFLDDHHGDGRVALNCRASAEMHDILQRLAPHQFHLPKYLGNRGWIGLWLDVPRLSWSAVELALREAHAGVAARSVRGTAPARSQA